jgi:pilus assembly protein CpaD
VGKVIQMTLRNNSSVAAAIALSLGLALTGCADGAPPANTSLNSVAQPVVERNNYTLDVAAGAGGVAVPEQQRLADWFETMNLRYGDRVAVDGALAGEAVREDVAAIAARYGLLLSEGVPVTEGFSAPGTVRVVVTRSHAYVPGCPDWTEHGSVDGTPHGFGCAINSNFAAMVADPEHLLHGAEGTGETVVMSSNRAISTFREAKPTGAAGLPEVSTQSGGGN